jgi:NAD(P)-dependent dehydrogenase (short-subunit alcohol dehydrogenase family)
MARQVHDRPEGHAQPANGVRELRPAVGARAPGLPGIEGSFAIVVGGSRGLGADVCRALHDAGANTVSVSRVGGDRNTPWRQEALDASDHAAVDRFFADRAGDLGARNLLVNCAGLRYNVPLAQSDPAGWRECVESSLFTTYLMMRGFARACGDRPGAIVNISSMHAYVAASGRSAYGAAKAAVAQLTAIAAVELAPSVRVNCVAPGFIATEAFNAMIDAGRLDHPGIVRRTPLARLGQADDVTRAVMFLLSDESRFITGETLKVDGGWLHHAEV